jgi:hypothetical protein
VLGSIVSDPLYSWPLRPDGSLPRVDRLTYPEDLYSEIAPCIMRPGAMTYEQARAFMELTPAEFRSVLGREGEGIERELCYYFS